MLLSDTYLPPARDRPAGWPSADWAPALAPTFEPAPSASRRLGGSLRALWTQAGPWALVLLLSWHLATRPHRSRTAEGDRLAARADRTDRLADRSPAARRTAGAESTGATTSTAGAPRALATTHIPEHATARLAGYLGRLTRVPGRADAIARVMVRESRRRSIALPILVGVLLTENADLVPDTVNFAGAVGLMQVMPMHVGRRECANHDLTTIAGNVCHGAGVLQDRLDARHGDLTRALLDYNGCVQGTVTPTCFAYPRVVLRHAREVARVLAAAPEGAEPGAPALAQRDTP